MDDKTNSETKFKRKKFFNKPDPGPDYLSDSSINEENNVTEINFQNENTFVHSSQKTMIKFKKKLSKNGFELSSISPSENKENLFREGVFKMFNSNFNYIY